MIENGGLFLPFSGRPGLPPLPLSPPTKPVKLLVNQHLMLMLYPKKCFQMDNNGGGESSYHYELRIVPGAKVNGLAASGWYPRNYDNQIE
jgi:hypothetical protein